MHELLIAIVLGVVEGVTEFLPVSSTGHLLLVERWMGLKLESGFWNMFTVFIQIGAIAAVVVYFRGRILELLRGQPERTLTPLEISASARSMGKAAVTAHAGPAAAEVIADDTPPTAAQRGYAILMIILASTPLVVEIGRASCRERVCLVV